MDVPGALRDAAAAWEQAGRPQQGATEYLRGRWLDALPEHADLIRALPERLNRSDSRELVAGLLERGDVVGAFVVSQIWGYGRRGYGPYRVRRVLDQDGAARRLEAAYDVLRSRGPVAAFAAFADEHRLTGLGPAFFTKFMFLADPSACALILDEYVAAWLQKHAGLKLSLNPPRSSEVPPVPGRGRAVGRCASAEHGRRRAADLRCRGRGQDRSTTVRTAS